MIELSAQTTANEVRCFGPEHAHAVVDVLDRAFAEDPFVGWLVPDGPKSAESRTRYFDMVLQKLTLPFGEVYTTQGVDGAALWVPPGCWEIGLVEQLALIPTVGRIVGFRRLDMVLRGVADVERMRPEPPWFLLALLGTAPAARGQGIGSALLRPVLDRCDREGIPAVLDTSNEANLQWYARHGFRVAGEVTLPEGPPCWSMVRRPV